jgi:hypothetical protein
MAGNSNLFFITNFGRELVEYKVDLEGVQEIRCDKRGTVRIWDYISSM